MTETLRRAAATEEDDPNEGVSATTEASQPPIDVELERKKLRQRWELASILNFLVIFEPLIGNDLKISAEEIETALIQQNNTLARLHVALLKGIPPLSKTLNISDGWMTALSKKLAMWWPWVAVGDFPFTGAKGDEISIYKKLDPITRLLLLKALCEVRADQYDAVSYINEEMKTGSEVSTFRKEKLAGDGNGITIWHDGNETIGHRLYKEVQSIKTERVKGKSTILPTNSNLEILATNLEEFQKIVDEFSSSEIEWKVALSKSIEVDIIPLIEKQQKKKQRLLQKRQREQMLLNSFRNTNITRSCRNQKPVNYRFDDYDKAITEAIRYVNKRETYEDQKQGSKLIGNGTKASSDSNSNSHEGEYTDSDTEKKINEESDNDSSHEEYESEEENASNDQEEGESGQVDLVHRSKGSRASQRLAGIPGHAVPESVNLGAKRRLRQRVSVNPAAESVEVPDSEDER